MDTSRMSLTDLFTAEDTAKATQRKRKNDCNICCCSMVPKNVLGTKGGKMGGPENVYSMFYRGHKHDINEFVAMVNNSLWILFRYIQVPGEIITVANKFLRVLLLKP